MNPSSRSWHHADDRLLVDKIVTGPLENNVYLIACAATGEAVIIDAAGEPARILEMAAEAHVTAVLTTHGHWDHVGAADEVAGALEVPILIGPEDAAMASLEDTTALDAGSMAVGDLTLEIIATPGHTPGSRCIKVGNLIFTGDTLFPGGPGATGTPADFKQIMESLDTKLFTQTDETMILPGHGLDTTIGNERPSVEEWRRRGW
jgi:glyoxylase-like metal-dependent hydrolase (beta-lactamase superfamily II)